MRWCVALALVSTLLSTNALAAGKGGKNKKKNAKDTKSAVTLDTGTDPAHTEKSDPGPYAPKGTTGALAEEVKTTKEEEEVIKARPRDKGGVYGDFVFGSGQAVRPGPALREENTLPHSRSLGFILGGSVDLSPTFSLGLRVPFTYAQKDHQSDNGADSLTAFGSPEILGEYRYRLSELTTLPILFGVAIPVAQGDADPNAAELSKQNQNAVNLIADSASAFRDGELYSPQRLPVILGIGIRHERRALELHASTKFVMGFRVAGGFPDTAYLDGQWVNSVMSLRNVTLVGATYDITSKFWAGADVWLAYSAIPAIRYKSDATPLTPFQFELEPRLGLRLGKLRPSVGVLLPLGGRLADPGMIGVHLRIEYVF